MYTIAQKEEITSFDSSLFKLFDSFSGEGLVQFAEAITVVGSKPVVGGGAFILLLWLWFKRKNYLGMAVLALGVGGGNTLKNWIKEFVGRERPESALFAEEELAFPSGHAMVSLIFYVLLAFFIAKEFKSIHTKISIYTIGIMIALFSGTSRIILHVHYPSDVIGGYAAGYILLMLCLFIYHRFERRFHK